MKERKVVQMDVESLVPYENNVKIHDDKQVSKIAESIRKFGWRGNPIIVDENNVIISGHGRRLAAMKLGMTKVPVEVVSGLSEAEIKALRLADNRVAVSDVDTAMLRFEFDEIDDVTNLLDGIYDDKELDFTMADLSVMDESMFRSDIDDVVEEQKNAIENKIDNFSESNISIVKTLGFQHISGEYAPYVSKFITLLEKDGDEEDGSKAFGEFCKKYVGE